MPSAKIVINASPLILLCNSDLEFILPELYEEIVVPAAVWQEIASGSRVDEAAQKIPNLSWLTKVETALIPEIVRWDLGVGETEVLSYAFQNQSFIPVLDDMLAKKCAKAVSLPTLGTGSILIAAKRKGLIDSVEKSLRKLKDKGLWISESVIQMLKAKAGE
ncbi:MAG: DUF3368 domain-containing protein [Anaerolineales bacterium]|nr:DUF3368 domain-containing protein [Anaerolineales bacterium]